MCFLNTNHLVPQQYPMYIQKEVGKGIFIDISCFKCPMLMLSHCDYIGRGVYLIFFTYNWRNKIDHSTRLQNQCSFHHVILAIKGVAYMSPFQSAISWQKGVTINLSPSPMTYRNCVRTSNIRVPIQLMRTQREALLLIFPLQDYEKLLIKKWQPHKPP